MAKKQAGYYRNASPGDCLSRGEHPAGWYTEREPEGGAAENLIPESNWDDEERRSIRSQIRRAPPGTVW